jgi:phage regulator Rha-like protein
MNTELNEAIGNDTTLSSVHLAKLLKKPHSNVKRSLLLYASRRADVLGEFKDLEHWKKVYKGKNNQKNECYEIPRKIFMYLVPWFTKEDGAIIENYWEGKGSPSAKTSATTSGGILTMSSLTIHEITGKAHFNVLDDIRRTLKAHGRDPEKFKDKYTTRGNHAAKCYNLPLRETWLVVEKYARRYSKAVMARWKEIHEEACHAAWWAEDKEAEDRAFIDEVDKLFQAEPEVKEAICEHAKQDAYNEIDEGTFKAVDSILDGNEAQAPPTADDIHIGMLQPDGTLFSPDSKSEPLYSEEYMAAVVDPPAPADELVSDDEPETQAGCAVSKSKTIKVSEYAASLVAQAAPTLTTVVKDGVTGVDWGGSDGQVKTMSSLDIAELTGKNHADVMRDIRTTLEQDDRDASKFAGVYLGGNGQERPCYNLPRFECDLVVSGYSVKYRAVIIRRWHELESKEAPMTPSLPQDVGEALQLAADLWKQQNAAPSQQLQIQTQELVAELAKKDELLRTSLANTQEAIVQIETQAEQLEAQKPAVEFHGKFLASGQHLTMRQAAFQLKVPEQKLGRACMQARLLYRSGKDLMPHAAYNDNPGNKGYFSYKQGLSPNGLKDIMQLHVTPVGVAWMEANIDLKALR